MPTMTILVDGTVPVANDFNSNFAALNAALGTGTTISAYVAGDILYANATNTLARLPKGTDGQVLQLTAGLPAWGASNVPVGYRNYGAAFAGANTLTISRRLLRSGVLGMDAEVMGALLSRTTDKTLSFTDGSGDIRGGYTAGTGTISTTNTSAAVTFSSSQSFNLGDTVVTNGGAKYAILAGSGTSWTLEQLATATETTVAFTRSTTSTGHTLNGSRSPGALYFVYAWSNSGLDFYLDTTAPVTGYHPVNTGDKWAGIQVWNNLSNALDQTWSLLPGLATLKLKGSGNGSSYTTTSSSYADVDSVNLKRPLFIPVGGTLTMSLGLVYSDSAVGSVALAAAGSALSPDPFCTISSASATIYSTRGPVTVATGLAAYSLIFKTASSTLTLLNSANDSFAATGGITWVELEIREPAP